MGRGGRSRLDLGSAAWLRSPHLECTDCSMVAMASAMNINNHDPLILVKNNDNNACSLKKKCTPKVPGNTKMKHFLKNHSRGAQDGGDICIANADSC